MFNLRSIFTQSKTIPQPQTEQTNTPASNAKTLSVQKQVVLSSKNPPPPPIKNRSIKDKTSEHSKVEAAFKGKLPPSSYPQNQNREFFLTDSKREVEISSSLYEAIEDLAVRFESYQKKSLKNKNKNKEKLDRQIKTIYLRLIFTLNTISKNESIHDDHSKTLYFLIEKIFPLIEFSSVSANIKSLTNFLSITSRLYENQRSLMIILGDLYFKHPHYFIQPIQFYVGAYLLQKNHNQDINYRELTSILFSFIDSRKFLNKFEWAINRADTELFIALCAQIDNLKPFCDETLIQGLYEQAMQALNQHPDRLRELNPRVLEGSLWKKNPALYPDKTMFEICSSEWTYFRKRYEDLATIEFDPEKIRQFQKEQAEAFHKLFSNFFLKFAVSILTEPLINFEIIFMGSTAREELCPFSDLELAALVQEAASTELNNDILFNRERKSLIDLFKLLNILITSIGENDQFTPDYFTAVPFKIGFHIDPGLNPLEQEELVSTPQELANLQKLEPENYDPVDYRHCLRKSICLIQDDQPNLLFEEYQKLQTQIFMQPCEIKDSHFETMGQKRAYQALNAHLENFKDKWQAPVETLDRVNLKYQYMALLSHPFQTLAFYFNLSVRNTLDIIDALPLFDRMTKTLLKECVAALYKIRVRIHLLKQAQQEEVFLNELDSEEKDFLFRTYYLVLKPLYHGIEGWLKPENEKSLSDVLFNWEEYLQVPRSCQLDQELHSRISPSFIEHFVPFLEKNKVSNEDHTYYFKQLSNTVEFEDRRITYLNCLKDQEIKKSLLLISNPNGLKRGVFEDLDQLYKMLSAISDPEEKTIVEIQSPFLNGIRYLKQEVVDKIFDLTELEIRQKYIGSQHNVAHWKHDSTDLHFKQFPSHPIVEFGIYHFFYRMMGKASPANTLVRLKIGNKILPVLVSETLQGVSLKNIAKPSLNPEQLSWQLLGAILTRPGDGIANNLFYKDKQILFIDNEVSFIEPVVMEKRVFDFLAYPKLNFASLLFTIDPKFTLSPTVIEKFCQFDPMSFLLDWINDLIAYKQKLLTCFSTNELDSFKSESTSSFLPEGLLPTMFLQFSTLQKYLRNKAGPINALDLLENLITLKNMNVSMSIGKWVRQKYETALNKPTAISRLESALQRSTSQSLSPQEGLKAMFNTIPTKEDAENSKRYTLKQAKEELLAFKIFDENFRLIKTRQGVSLNGHFERCTAYSKSAIETQAFMLNALRNQMAEHADLTIAEVDLSNCQVLTIETLTSFLSENLISLNLNNCPKVNFKELELIARECPNLEKLHLQGCRDLIYFEKRSQNSGALFFPKLKFLDLSNCLNLRTSNLHAPELLELNISNNPKLEKSKLFKTQNDYSVKISCENCKNFDYHTFVTDFFELTFQEENQDVIVNRLASTLKRPFKDRTIEPTWFKFFRKLFTDKMIHMLGHTILANSRLHQLELINCNISDDLIEILSKYLKTCSNLKQLYLNNNPIGVRGAKALKEVLPNLSNLKELLIGDGGHNKICSTLGTLLLDLKECQHLCLQFDHCSDFIKNNIDLFNFSLTSSRNCTYLKLKNIIHLDYETSISLAHAFKENESINQIDFKNFLFTDKTAVAWAEAISQHKTLKRLSINTSYKEPLETIAQGFTNNTSLQEIYLDLDCYLQCNLSTLEKSIGNHGKLRHLKLRAFFVTREHVQALGEALEKNPTLAVLEIDSHYLDVASMATILNSLRNHRYLERIVLSYHLRDFTSDFGSLYNTTDLRFLDPLQQNLDFIIEQIIRKNPDIQGVFLDFAKNTLLCCKHPKSLFLF